MEIGKLNTSKSTEEVVLKAKSGMGMLVLNTIIMILCLGLFIVGCVMVEDPDVSLMITIPVMTISSIYLFLVGPILFGGLKVIKPNEALVLTLFGKYYGTLKNEGFFFVHPFAAGMNPVAGSDPTSGAVSAKATSPANKATAGSASAQVNQRKKISLKAMTLNNDKQKINDALGNPIIIGVVVIWKVVNTAKAVFNVDNFNEYLSIQCDSALRNIVRLFPYDAPDDENEKTLRGSSQEVAQKMKEELQSKVDIAGLEILEARITHLSYAPEIAAVMLQRQQASAIIAARQMIVEGAVGMVEMALARLSEKEIVHLDEERKAAMVSNLLVVLCGNKDAQPVVNSGSIY